jgi:hypothetical protein
MILLLDLGIRLSILVFGSLMLAVALVLEVLLVSLWMLS